MTSLASTSTPQEMLARLQNNAEVAEQRGFQRRVVGQFAQRERDAERAGSAG